jgi:xanthine dehydrogenase molybdopterin-binding subunit B
VSGLKKEEFEDTKEVIRIRTSSKDRQHNGQQKKYKRTNNDLQINKSSSLLKNEMTLNGCTRIFNFSGFCNLIPSDIWPDKRGGLLDTPVSSTNKTGCHDITEILLKVALNPITLTLLMMRKGGKWKNTQYPQE